MLYPITRRPRVTDRLPRKSGSEAGERKIGPCTYRRVTTFQQRESAFPVGVLPFALREGNGYNILGVPEGTYKASHS